VSLADARRKTLEHRAAVAGGRDILAEKRQARVPTFLEAAKSVHETHRPRWRSDRHAVNWWASLEKHAFPEIGDMRVDRITQSDVFRVLTPIWTTRPEVARKTRQRIRTILRWAMAHGYVHYNVAGEAIDGALPPMPRVQSHFRSLPYTEVADALAVVDESRASPSAKLCLRFTVLTAARSGEARNATWDEIDFDSREWRIPAEKMKIASEHRVPLSDAVLDVLDQAKNHHDGSDLVFPSPRADKGEVGWWMSPSSWPRGCCWGWPTPPRRLSTTLSNYWPIILRQSCSRLSKLEGEGSGVWKDLASSFAGQTENHLTATTATMPPITFAAIWPELPWPSFQAMNPHQATPAAVMTIIRGPTIKSSGLQSSLWHAAYPAGPPGSAARPWMSTALAPSSRPSRGLRR